MTNHVLLKFISQKSFVDDFLNGSLYMNSLYYFWNEYPIKEAAIKRAELISLNPEVDLDNISFPIDYKISPAQADMFEGTVGFDNSKNSNMSIENHMFTDTIIRAVGFQFCDTLSFYRLDYEFDNMILHYDLPNMKEFGNYVAIIKDKKELLRRVNEAAKRDNINYLCGDVHYRGLKKSGVNTDFSRKNHITLKCDALFNMDDFNLKSKRDCFIKMDKYSWQREWRIAVYRGVKDTNAYRLEIGNIKDIVECVSAENLVSTIDRLLRYGEIKTWSVGFYGNISRRDMKEKFYQLGDNMAEMFWLIG